MSCWVKADSKTLSFVCAFNAPPSCILNEGGANVRGFLPEIMDVLNQHLDGYQIKSEATHWQRAQSLVKDGKADLFLTVPTPKREEYALFIEKPLIRSVIAAFYLEGSQFDQQLKFNKNLEKTLLAAHHINYRANGWFNKHYANSEHIYYSSDMLSSIELIAKGRGDVFIHNQVVTEYHIKSFFPDSKILFKPLKKAPVDYLLGISKKSSKTKEKYKELERVIHLPQVQSKIKTLLANYSANL